MTLFSMGPEQVDMPKRIAVLLQPLQGETFKCDEVIAQNIWRLLELYEHLEFDIRDHDREHDAMGRGTVYKRKKEAAELTLRAFKSTFGEVGLEEAKGGAMRAALCEARGVKSPVTVSPEEIDKGKKFFKAWYAEANKHLSRATV